MKYTVANARPPLYPILQLDGNYLVKWNNNQSKENDEVEEWLPILDNLESAWGDAPIVRIVGGSSSPLPSAVEVIWLSVIEKQLYKYKKEIDARKAETYWYIDNKNSWNSFSQILVGLAPCGGVALWFRGYNKSILFSWEKAEALNTDQVSDELLPDESIEEIYQVALNEHAEIKSHLEQNGLPQPSFYNRLMAQFCYKFMPVFKKWNVDEELWKDYEENETLPELYSMEVRCFDGTYDKLRDGGLQEYHTTGKPSHLNVSWHFGNHNYGAYFFFNHEELQTIFSRCYGTHPETRADFLIKMDSETQHYELALYRYGMKEPMVISESAYQLIVFKNSSECFRSENYNLPPGLWRW